MADLYLVVLRAVHIAGAVFWAGGTFVMVSFHQFVLDPGDGERRLDRLADYAGVSEKIGITGLVSVIAGLLLYWEVSGGLNAAWIGSAYGLTITVGAAAGILAFVVGAGVVGLTNNEAAAMADEVDLGCALTAEQSAQVEAYRKRILFGERLVATLLLVAVLAMATAQYL